MHAFFADGVDKMHILWAVEGLPMLLHLALFLFLGGLVIFLFNVDQEVFRFVVWWIGLFTLVYGLITLLPFIRHNSPFYGPLSLLAWFLYASIPYVTFTVLSFISGGYVSYETCERYRKSRDRYRGWMLGGVEQAAEELVEERSSEIDGRILGWTIRALGDDDLLEKFFEAIPGLFNSTLVIDVERHFPETHLKAFWSALDGFMGRTSSSNLVTESVRSHRNIICRDVISMIPCPEISTYNNLRSHFDQAPVSIERSQAMARWITHSSLGVSSTARIRVFKALAGMKKRDNRWIALVSTACGLAAHNISSNVTMRRDDMFLATLIDISRQAIQSEIYVLELVEALAQIDIRHTLPRLQHDFCTLWNELAEEAKDRGYISTPTDILPRIRRLYITLHQGTDAAPTAFSASTDSFDGVLFEPSSYPLCNIASHRPDPTARVPLLTQPTDLSDASPHRSTSGGSTASLQVQKAGIIAESPSLSDPTKPGEIGDGSQAPAATSPALPVPTNPSPTDASPPGAAVVALQVIPPATIDEMLSQAPTLAPEPTIAPVPASNTLVLNKPVTSHHAGTACTPDPLHPASSIVSFSIPVSPPPPRVRPLPKTPSRPSSNTTLPRLRARGLVNLGNMCFASAVLHLLVHSPPFWDLFRELGDSKGDCKAEGSKTSGGATPLVDSTVRFCEEFRLKAEEPPTTQQPPPQAAGGVPREDEDAKKEHNAVDSFDPTYMYDAMKEKRQLKNLLVRSHAQDALFCY